MIKAIADNKKYRVCLKGKSFIGECVDFQWGGQCLFATDNGIVIVYQSEIEFMIPLDL